MKRLVVGIALMILFISSQVFAEEWDVTDKSLYVGFIACEVGDFIQTVDILKDGREMNPIVEWADKKAGKVGVGLYFVAFAYGTKLIADNLSSKNRKVFLSVWDSLYIGVIDHNYKLGYKFNF